MSNNKVRVVAGYTKKEVYNGKIEYRAFNPDLVGLQLASDGGTPLFTMGNFSITTNMEPKTDKTYVTSRFSDFISLDSLNLTFEQTKKLLTDNAGVLLNLDKTKLKYYALFGSLTEFVRVSLEDIITKWPASLYIRPISMTSTGQMINGLTYEGYSYDSINNISSFKVNTSFIENKFGINYLTNGTIADTFNETNDLRNMTINYSAYSILLNNLEYPVLNFTGSTYLTSDYIYLDVQGDVFSGQPSTILYHIKPNKTYEEEFFNELPEFENYLLNRSSYPLYTAKFNFPTKSDSGIILYISKTLTWPVSDGYNIDFDSGQYISYATDLFDIAANNDLYSSDLMNRFLVSESITSFDTMPVHLADEHMDSSGQKVNKTLSIYGRSFDDFNNFIVGIAFAHTVTYDKLDNMPDIYLKDLARVLGWDIISSVMENNLLSNYIKTGKSPYAGQSVGLTPVEADIELWRRLILNSPWIWKSKGARKSVEFLLKFIGTPQGLVTFNEYIYRVDAPIDIDLFIKILELNDLDVDLTIYPIDDDGYPRVFPDNPDMYFQNDGLWYRETGGANSVVDILTGNNPHVGPYDGGSKYMNQFKTLIPNFSAVTITGETIVTGATNLFTNYNLGVITDYTGATYVDVTNTDGSELSNCVVVTSSIEKDDMPKEVLSACGCPCGTQDDVLSVCVKRVEGTPTKPCATLGATVKEDKELGYYIFSQYQYNADGSLFSVNGVPVLSVGPFIDKECCASLRGQSSYYDVYNPKTNVVDSGYVCCITNKCGCEISCNWILKPKPILLPLNSPNASSFCDFTTLYGSGINKVVTTDGSNCPPVWTEPIGGITDPYTGEVGFGCKITTFGLVPNEFQTMVNYFQIKANGGVGDYKCCSFTREIYIKLTESVK